MTEQLPGMESERRDVALSQWFTPPELAAQIVEWALQPGALPAPNVLEVLEPSCGRGALVKALVARGCTVHGYDIDPANAKHCNQTFPGTFIATDFLTRFPLIVGGQYHLVVMNPPFENGAAEAHILHALKFAPRVVCHCPLTTLEGRKRREGLWSEAYLKRLAICSSRPKYGEKAGATAMCTIDVVRRPEGRSRGRVAASGVEIEWWA